MEDHSVYSLIRKFQQLQEERVHVYKIFQEGHKIYLSSAPNYNFIRFRALVQDVTQDFKRISEEIIKIECKLRVLHPDLSMYVADIQDSEKHHLELIARLQLAKQELQDGRNNGTKCDDIQQEIIQLKKQLADVHEKIRDSTENIRYQLVELV